MESISTTLSDPDNLGKPSIVDWHGVMNSQSSFFLSSIINELAISQISKEFAVSFSLDCALTSLPLRSPARTAACKHQWSIEQEYLSQMSQCACKVLIDPVTNPVIPDDRMIEVLSGLALIKANLSESNSEQQQQQPPRVSDSQIVFFSRSKLFFAMGNLEKENESEDNEEESVIPQPHSLLVAHIQTPSLTTLISTKEGSLNSIDNINNSNNILNSLQQLSSLQYTFKFTLRQLLGETFPDAPIRVCSTTFCFYDLYDKSIVYLKKCQHCSSPIDVFEFKVDNYMNAVRTFFFETLGFPRRQLQKTQQEILSSDAPRANTSESTNNELDSILINMQSGKFKYKNILYTPEKIIEANRKTSKK